MAKVPSYKRMVTGDYAKDQQKLVDQLGSTVNPSFDNLYQLANNGVDFKNNITCTITTIQVTVDSTGTPTKSTTYPLASFMTTVTGVWVVNPRSVATPAVYPTSGITISWTKNQNSVVINNITGLPSGVAFNLTIITI